MDCNYQELLALTGWLTKKYTSNESSSVTYETANMLMEAVLYCIHESIDNPSFSGDFASHDCIQGSEQMNYRSLYEHGYQQVLSNVNKARELYHSLTSDFYDYHCENYMHTILKGIPAFFLHYDARFQPQNHILTLDYPTAVPIKLAHTTSSTSSDEDDDLLPQLPALCGIDLILPYLSAICLEKTFLDAFSPTSIESLLQRIMPEYRTLFIDNICSHVLLDAIGCMAAHRSVADLQILPQDYPIIKDFFGDCIRNSTLQNPSISTQETLTRQISSMTATLLTHVFPENHELHQYLDSLSADLAARIALGLEYNCLQTIFV